MKVSFKNRLLRLLLLSAFTVFSCLIFSTGPSVSQSSAQSSFASQLVQLGVTAYREHDYQAAIQQWESALTTYSEDEASIDRAIILENLARAYQQLGQPTPALEYWQQATATYLSLQNWSKVGRSLTEQAQTYSNLGQPHQAIQLLCTDEGHSSASSTVPPTTTSPSVRDLDGRQEVNNQQMGCQPESAISISQTANDFTAQIAVLGSLGEAYRTVQAHDAAIEVLESGLTIAIAQNDVHSQALLHNSLGNTYRELFEIANQQAATARQIGSDEGNTYKIRVKSAALEHFSTSYALAEKTDNVAIEIKSLIGRIALNTTPNSQAEVSELRSHAISLLSQLLPNQEKAYLALQLTKSPKLITLNPTASPTIESEIPNSRGTPTLSDQSSRSLCQDIFLDHSTQQLLETSNTLANTLGNNRLKAFSQGEIGHYYECSKNYEEALHWTQQARLAASGDRVLALDTLYLWQWQTGRIYKALQQVERAIEFYSQAAMNLNRVRSEILASNQTLQFDFKDTIAPVYRELAEIQLSLVPTSVEQNQVTVKEINTSENGNELNIQHALGSIDNLQLAELQNYFGSDCLVPTTDIRLDDAIGNSTPEDSQITSSALINTIIFPDKTAVILTLPEEQPILQWVNISETDLRQSVIDFRISVETFTNDLEDYNTQQAQRLYHQLIPPSFEQALARNNIKTLVFVNDGILRNIPMAALYDGRQYLIEKYAIAIAPSLQIPEAPTKRSSSPRALVLGLSQDSIVNGVPLRSLPAVQTEVKGVQSLLNVSDSDLLLEENLTKENLEEKLKNRSYSLLHVATHGQFETDPSNTFLVLGDKETDTSNNNNVLRLGELDTLIREGAPRTEPLELIVLSACETASGDERATLGLAGVTIRAGTQSAIASLWTINDAATAELITDFYKNWQEGMNKGEALREAQISMMKNTTRTDWRHPAHWSSFILVGNWV